MKNSTSMITDSGLTLAADVVVSSIPIPEMQVIWALCKGLYGIGMQLRQERVNEWVEMIKDNPSVFGAELLADKKFQDGFVYMLEQYLRERNEQRRLILKSIFLGFAVSASKDEFPLEKYAHTLSQLDNEDISNT